MKTTFSVPELRNALSVMRATAVKSMPSLSFSSSVLVNVEDGTAVLSGTNLDSYATFEVKVEADGDGEFCLPHEFLSGLLAKTKGGSIAIDVDDEAKAAVYKCGKAEYRSTLAQVRDFPGEPSVGSGVTVNIPGRILEEMLHLTLFCAGKDDINPINAVVHFEGKGGKFSLCAIGEGSHRFSLIEHPLQFEGSFSALVPTKSLRGIAQQIADAEWVKLTVTDSFVRFAFDNFTFMSRVIDGSYPDVRKLIPTDFESVASINREQFQMAAERTLLVDVQGPHGVVLDVSFSSSQALLTVVGQTQGGNEVVDVELEGAPFEFRAKAAYLTAFLSAVDSENVLLSHRTGNKHGHVWCRRPDDDSFLHLIVGMATPKKGGG